MQNGKQGVSMDEKSSGGPRMVKIPPTRQFPWHIAALIGGLMLSFLAWMTLYLKPQGHGRTATYALLAGGLLLALVGLIWTLNRRRKAERGLVPAGDGGRAHILPGLILLLLLTFVLFLWPFPYPYALVGNILAFITFGLAIWLAWRLLQNRPPMDYGRARRAYHQGNDQTALSLLSAAEERSPDYYGIPYLCATIYREQGEYAAAHEACQRLIAQHPDLYYGYAELGLTLLAENKPEKARAPLGKAVQIAPFLPEGYLNLGMACVEAEDHEGAVDALSRALRLGLRDSVAEVMARYHLLQAFEGLGDDARAQVERRRLRRRRNVLRHWRSELEEDTRQAEDRDEEKALLAAIERAIKEPT